MQATRRIAAALAFLAVLEAPLMKFEYPLIPAALLRRYQRFLADVELSDGSTITVHCPNTGSMRNCIVENSPCWLLDSANPKRKYRYSLERVTTPTGAVAGINSASANGLVIAAIENGVISELQGYDELAKEQRYGDEKSRIDILLSKPEEQCYIEVKSVTLEEGKGEGFFPDAVSTRGQKHLRELMAMRSQGHRAVLFFCVQHSGIKKVAAAEHIDPAYAALFKQAVNEGVEVIAYGVDLGLEGSVITKKLNVV